MRVTPRNTPTASAFNRLVDAIAPESDAARKFRNTVDQYLTGGKDPQIAVILRHQLAIWQEEALAVRPLLERNSLLTENVPVADALVTLCKTGEEALDYLGGTKQNATTDWKQRETSQVEEAGKRHGDLLLPISPGIEALVQAVSTTP